MTKAENLEMAGEFASSMRGRFIIAKALHYGIQELEKVEGVHKERLEDLRLSQKSDKL